MFLVYPRVMLGRSVSTKPNECIELLPGASNATLSTGKHSSLAAAGLERHQTEVGGQVLVRPLQQVLAV